jgi:putative ABC transport system substrate-binding protein
LVAQSSPAVAALRRLTNTIPTVFLVITDPLGQGFIHNLAHPGGNMTGFSDYDPPIAGKWVGLLKQIKPAIGSVALLYNPASTPFADLILGVVEPAARSLALSAHSSACRDDAEIDTATKLARNERGGVLVMPEVFTTVHRDAIVAAAARHRVPAIYPDETSTTHGELMSYGIDPADVFRRSASYLDRILKGERSPGAESDQIQADDQPQDRAGDRTSGPADAARACRRGHRITVRSPFILPFRNPRPSASGTQTGRSTFRVC